MGALVRRVTDSIEIRESDKYDRERGNEWVLAFISPNGSATLSPAFNRRDVARLRAALADPTFHSSK